MPYFNIFQKKWLQTATLEPLAVPVEPISAAVHCSGACSSYSRACTSSSGQRLQPLKAPGALSFSRGLAFSPSGAATLPHINYACLYPSNIFPKCDYFQRFSQIGQPHKFELIAISPNSLPSFSTFAFTSSIVKVRVLGGPNPCDSQPERGPVTKCWPGRQPLVVTPSNFHHLFLFWSAVGEKSRVSLF